MKTKTCTLCGETKPLTEFGKHKLGKDGLNYWCKECNRKRGREYNNSPVGIYSRIKGRANYERKKPFNLIKNDFIEWYNAQPQNCVYCEISEDDIVIWETHFNRWVKKLSIDCMDNDVGYIIDNLVLACERCNTIKGNMFSHEQMLEIGQKYVRPIWERLKEEKTSE